MRVSLKREYPQSVGHRSIQWYCQVDNTEQSWGPGKMDSIVGNQIELQYVIDRFSRGQKYIDITWSILRYFWFWRTVWYSRWNWASSRLLSTLQLCKVQYYANIIDEISGFCFADCKNASSLEIFQLVPVRLLLLTIVVWLLLLAIVVRWSYCFAADIIHDTWRPLSEVESKT